MKTQKIFFLATLVIAFITISSFNSTAQDSHEILDRMEYNMRGDASYSEMTMETVRPRYTREISMKSWSLGDDYALVYVTAPAREEGTSTLKRGNDMWSYDPNVDRTIRMPPSMMSQSWMGSDFTNDDLVSGTSTVDDFDHQLLGTETVDGHECYKIELKPHPETPVVYEEIIYWVSKEHYLPVKVENYDDFGELASTINFSDFKTMDGRTVPAVMEMIPEDKEEHKTIITQHKVEFDIDISQQFFSVENLTSIE